MRSLVFVFIVLVSGAAAGAVYGAANQAMVEPYLDEAIGIENQNILGSGDVDDDLEFLVEYESYRLWQKGGQMLASVILGMSLGALFGIVYYLARAVLPGGHDIKKALVLAGVMWLVLFMVPLLKYPANPPTVGDADTVEERSVLWAILVAVSGFSALGFYILSRRMRGRSRLLCAVGYCAVVGAAFAVLPDGPDASGAPADLVWGFRVAAAAAVAVYWVALPVFLGAMWRRLGPDRQLIPENN